MLYGEGGTNPPYCVRQHIQYVTCAILVRSGHCPRFLHPLLNINKLLSRTIAPQPVSVIDGKGSVKVSKGRLFTYSALSNIFLS